MTEAGRALDLAFTGLANWRLLYFGFYELLHGQLIVAELHPWNSVLAIDQDKRFCNQSTTLKAFQADLLLRSSPVKVNSGMALWALFLKLLCGLTVNLDSIFCLIFVQEAHYLIFPVEELNNWHLPFLDGAFMNSQHSEDGLYVKQYFLLMLELWLNELFQFDVSAPYLQVYWLIVFEELGNVHFENCIFHEGGCGNIDVFWCGKES